MVPKQKIIIARSASLSQTDYFGLAKTRICHLLAQLPKWFKFSETWSHSSSFFPTPLWGLLADLRTPGCRSLLEPLSVIVGKSPPQGSLMTLLLRWWSCLVSNLPHASFVSSVLSLSSCSWKHTRSLWGKVKESCMMPAFYIFLY